MDSLNARFGVIDSIIIDKQQDKSQNDNQLLFVEHKYLKII